MNIIHSGNISTKLLHREGTRFTAEASELGRSFRINQLFDDACDAGVVVQSHITGKRVPFVLAKTETECGEVQFWRFESLGGTYSLVVYND